MYSEVYYLPLYGLCLICGWLYLRKVTGEAPDRLFFLVCMTFNFIYFCTTITTILYALFLPQYYSSLYAYEDILVLCLPILVFWLPFAWIMSRIYSKLQHLIIPNMWRISVIPLLFPICLWFQDTLLSSARVGIIQSSIIEGLIVFCAFLTYSQMISSLTNAEKAAKEQENMKFLSLQFDLQKKRMEEMELHADEMRRIRHDRRQHVEVLKGFLADGQLEKAQEYLKDYETSLSKNIQPPLCENFAVDTICRRYQLLAKQAGISIEISIILSKNPKISSTDLTVILGNLWENAIAAALDLRADKFIRLRITEKNGKIFIRMENSFEKVVMQKDGKYLSTKVGRNCAEGIGISSVKAAAEKYNGITNFSHDQNVFTASILLYEEI